MADRDFIFWMAEELRRVAEPLEAGLRTRESFVALLERYGWSPPPGSFQIADVRDAFDVTDDISTATLLIGEILAPASGDVPLDTYLALAETFKRVADKARRLSQRPRPAGLSEELWTTFGRDLLHGLIADYLESYRPLLLVPLIITGVVEEELVDPGGTPHRIPYVRRRIRWSRLEQALTDPDSLTRELYGWDDPNGPLHFELLLDRLHRALRLLGLPTVLAEPGAALVAAYYTPTNPHLARVQELRILLMGGEDEQGELLQYTLGVLPIPRVGAPAEAPDGLVLAPSFVLGTQPSGLLWPFSLEFGGVLQTEGGVRLELEPGRTAVATGGPDTSTVDASFAIIFDSPNAQILLGTAFSHRLQLHGWRIGVQVSGAADAPEFSLELGLRGLELVVVLSEGDRFLQEVFGDGTRTMGFDASLVWSSKTGFNFRAQGALELVVPVHLTIGAIQVDFLTVGLTATDRETSVVTAVTGSAKLGPLVIGVANVGLKVVLTPVPEGRPAGVLGDLDLDFGFKPPDGIGLVIDAGPVTGGGFLGYDEATGRYVGALELEVYDFAVKAFGILDTRLPGGRPAYSFLIIVSTEFTPIPIGFGFTLNGVGGLAGIHRRLAVDVFRQRLGQGTLDHILFPSNPIQDAPLIVSDLQAVIPPAADRYVFGPMAIIAWGVPALLEGKLAILLEIPDPVRLVLLGQFHIVLPRKDSALVTLNLDLVGELEPARQRLALDGRLHDSNVVGFPIEGELAVRITGGSDPSFALSIGGFNPAFRPPAGFPALQRITVPIGLDDDPRITLEGYLALTSNTLQVGALATAYASAGWFNITGHVGFNALFVFSPFSFVTDFSGKVALNKGKTQIAAIKLEAIISGPTPWRVAGEACLEIRWFPDICVGVHATFGEDIKVELPTVDPFPALREAVENPESWSGERPLGLFRAATTAIAMGASGRGLLDPAEGATLRQTVVPLARQITRFGASQPPGGTVRFDLQAVTLAGTAVAFSPAQDLFAPAQFEDMSDDEKLSRPGFERMDAGLTIARDAVALGQPVDAAVEYETRILDSTFVTRPGGLYHPTRDLQLAASALSSAAVSPLRNSGPAKFALLPAQPPLVSLAEERFVVVSTTDLSERRDIVLPAGKGAAFQALAAHLSAHPENRGRLEVLSIDELPTAA